ncbi:MAG: DUF2255 family protein [Candidatus Dormibacteraceae bacterium]
MKEQRAIKSTGADVVKGDAPVSEWTKDELTKISNAEEMQIAPFRHDGTMRSPVTIWAVRHGDGIYVRSASKGRQAAWFRGAQDTHEGRIRAGRLEKDVTLVDADRSVDGEVDSAYRAKYGLYAGRILDSVLTPESRSTTMKLVPRSTLG